MAKENVKKFFDEVSKSEDLQKQLQTATEKVNADMQKALEEQASAVVEVAKNAGFDFTAEELISSAQQDDKKLEQDELDAVAGGGCTIIGFTKDKKFACFTIGGGHGIGCLIHGLDK